MPSSIKLPSGEVIPLHSVCPPIPKKHHRETSSQYQYRLSKVNGYNPENINDNMSNSTIHSTFSFNHTNKQKRNHNQRSKSTAMQLIARYKHKKYVKSCLNKILYTIYHYILRKRFKKYTYYAIVIQKYIRRCIVLKNIETLIISLLERKKISMKLKAQMNLSNEFDSKDRNIPPRLNSPRSESENPTLTKDKSRKNIERQHSNESTTSNSSTSVLKLFKQVSGCQEESMKLTSHNLSKMSSRRLLTGIIQSPIVTIRKEIVDENQPIIQQNPKQLYQKKSFSRTLSDVLSRKEMEQSSPTEKICDSNTIGFNKVCF